MLFFPENTDYFNCNAFILMKTSDLLFQQGKTTVSVQKFGKTTIKKKKKKEGIQEM